MRSVRRRATSSQSCDIVIEVSASAQRPQKVHLPKSNETVRWYAASAKASAPVGQAAAPGRASFQLAKLISGRPRPNRGSVVLGAGGNGLVTIPVAKLLIKISNII